MGEVRRDGIFENVPKWGWKRGSTLCQVWDKYRKLTKISGRELDEGAPS